KLRTVDPATTIKKGNQVTASGDTYIENRTELAFADDLDRWSAQRTASLARANALAYRSYSGSNGYWPGGFSPYFINGSAWLYSPRLNGFTFIPQTAYRSYYGFTFIPRPTFGFSHGGSGHPISTSQRSSTSAGGRSGPFSTGRSGGRISGRAGGRR